MFSLEILGLEFSVAKPKVAMFDFDGTVSTMREGWHALLTNYFVSRLKQTPVGAKRSDDELREDTLKGIEPNIGKLPLYQFYTLVEMLKARGGKPEEAETYLQAYYRDLFVIVERRHKQLLDGGDPDELMLPGTRDLLKRLQHRGIKLYLVSGTEAEFVQKDAELLRITDYFDGGVFGGTADKENSSKHSVIARILRENNIDGAELVSFGDGQTETREIKAVGGLAVGVASDETKRDGIDDWKRRQLVEAGADWIIPHFSDTVAIEQRLFQS